MVSLLTMVPPLAVLSADYYVDGSVSASGNGSFNNPFNTTDGLVADDDVGLDHDGSANFEDADPRASKTLTTSPIKVHQAVSPNGDGRNDLLMVAGVGDYPENRMLIFDRHGKLVYKASGYNNRNVAFRGVDTSGGYVPPGTYFYTMETKINGKWEFQKGYFLLKY